MRNDSHGGSRHRPGVIFECSALLQIQPWILEKGHNRKGKENCWGCFVEVGGKTHLIGVCLKDFGHTRKTAVQERPVAQAKCQIATSNTARTWTWSTEALWTHHKAIQSLLQKAFVVESSMLWRASNYIRMHQAHSGCEGNKALLLPNLIRKKIRGEFV